ncbi:MFS transporter [Azospirillum fermentarium]|uniref:MFS transporter n=1 Tax=Azospirillum fermentarium TaxID=1233114 RepID=UPI0022272447|nr:MFS transporter [Azospirillum fermentarium]
MLTPAERRAKIGAVLRVSSGNFLEMYDFMVYGYYANYIAKTFFPSDSEFASLMLSLATFGAGYLMRPLGAILLGSYIDRKGRRTGLILTLGLMAIGTVTIAVTPGYDVLGPAAPLLVVIGRLLQGLSAGVELGGVSIYLSEIATPGNRGFYCSWQSASQQVAVMFAALIGVALTTILPPEEMVLWGWRVPLLIGCMIIPLILFLRRSLQETEEFQHRKHRPSAGEVLRVIAANWRLVGIGMMLSVMTTTTFYLITAYTPTFGRQALHLAVQDNLLVTLCVGLSNFLWLPIGGALSDRIGRRPLLLLIPALALVTAYPAMSWLVADPSFGKLLLVELWFSFFFGIYNGAMIPLLAEIMPVEVRTAGFSLAFSLATAVFGGFTPAVCTYLIETTGNRASPGLWLSLAAGISLIAAFAVRSRARAAQDANRLAAAAAMAGGD